MKPTFYSALIFSAAALIHTPTTYANDPGNMLNKVSNNTLNNASNNMHSAAMDLRVARDTYRAAKKALRRGDRKTFNRLKERLQGYALYPYLEYYALRRQARYTDNNTIKAFATRYQDSPLAARLQRHWLHTQAKHQQWATLSANYTPGDTPELDCYYYRAQFKQGNTALAYEGAQSLWNIGESQHKACDPLFSVWLKSDAFTPDIAWQRLEKVMAKGNTRMARYLERYLAPEQQAIAKEWRKVYQYPQRLKKTSRYTQWLNTPTTEAHAQAMLTAGLKRLLHRDYKTAHRLLLQYQKVTAFNATSRMDLYDYFARNLAVDYRPEATTWLNLGIMEADSEHLLEYGIRHALRSEDWTRVKRWIALLPPEKRDAASWRYWDIRAEKALQQQQSPLFKTVVQETQPYFVSSPLQGLDIEQFHHQVLDALAGDGNFNHLLPTAAANLLTHNQTPVERLAELANQRSFYSFMASRKINQELQLNHAPYNPSKAAYSAVYNSPGVQRARELTLVDEPLQAAREWFFAVNRLPKETRSIAAHIAAEWGWHNKAIIAAARAEDRNDLSIRFPRPHQNVVSQTTQKYGIQPDWVYSLMRQESAFLPNAQSPVGAMGLMQLMPSTAREVAKTSRIRLRHTKQLLDAHKNIQLGTAYLGQLLKRFNGNLVVASAAYNAGPHRAERWQPKNDSMPGDIWIETIPIKETRNYVKNIVTYQPIYQSQMGMQPTLTAALDSIAPRG